ncbi:adenylate cyclase type 10-like [Saccoglossus kowalevskii]
MSCKTDRRTSPCVSFFSSQFTIDTCVIFVVDDAHFIDKDSWDFITDLAEDSSAVCLLAMRPFPPNKASCPSAAKVLQNPATLHIKLHGIPQEYLEELACQILNVIAIPKELLKILQERSHGLASWCEQLINDMFISAKIKVIQGTEINHEESETNTQERTTKVCVISPNVNLSEIPVPDSMTGMLLAKIDRLKSADQMVVKCAAVLGLTFTPSLLEVVVPNTSSKRIRMALHSLMQSRVFECATPKTHTNSEFSSINYHGHHNKLSSRVECHCLCSLESTVDDHSNIANCKLLRFRTSMMQEVAYTLFLNEQRRSLHEQAALFLESRAHKCRSCGGGECVPHYQSLSHDMTVTTKPDDRRNSKSTSKGGTSSGSGWRAKSRSNKKNRVSNRIFQADTRGGLGILDEQGKSIEAKEQDKISPRRTSILDSVRKFFRRNNQVDDDDDQSKLAAASARRNRRTSLELSDNLKNNIGGDVISEELMYREIDLRDCECPQVLASVYPQLVRHWKAASNTARTIHFLTEAGGAAVATHNNMAGLSYLLEVHHMLKSLEAGKKPFPDDPEEKPIIEDETKARVERLIGQALFHMGRLEEAMPHLKRALKVLGNKQPTTRMGVYFRLMVEGFIQCLHLKNPHKYVGRASVIDCNRFVEQARCLSHVWHGYHEAHDDTWALLAALQHVNRAEKADDDFHDLMEGYCIMMESCHALLWFRRALVYEELALNRSLEIGKLSTDLSTLGHLYSVVMSLRLADGRIQKAVEAGVLVMRLPVKSTPHTANGGIIFTRYDGNGA